MPDSISIQQARRQLAALLARDQSLEGVADAVAELQDLLADVDGVRSVASYGAAGDGVTDDTAAIQAAIDAAEAAGGGDVRIESGKTYLCTDSINMKSGVHIVGTGTLKCGAHDVGGLLLCEGISHFSITGISIDGGGQTSSVTAGFRACQAIRIDACMYFNVEGVNIYKCGVKNAAAPTTDSAHAGLGILVSALSGECAYGTIRRCRVRLIAGGGFNNGDGIEVAGYGTAPLLAHDIEVENCWVSTCGRHCYTVSGEAATGIPRNITFRKCYAEKSALDGVDIEDGTRVEIVDCRFVSCGNDQTYYNPAVEYGATYRLMAGVSINANDCSDIGVRACRFAGCYYGLNWSAAVGVTVEDCTFETGTFEDLSMGGAQSPSRVLLKNNRFLSTVSVMQFTYTATDSKDAWRIESCTFAKQIDISGSYDIQFSACNFLAGVRFVSTDIYRPSFIDCTFENFAGSAVTHSVVSQQVTEAVFRGCKFIGTGDLVNGISVQYDDAAGWVIEKCHFIGLTGAGITHANGNGAQAFARIVDNKFRSCATGISVNQGIKNGIIAGNVFDTITGYCIEFHNIQAGANLNQMTVSRNVAGVTVTNGLRVALVTGAWDFCIFTDNNFHTPTGTKWSLAAGNAGGVTADNITA